MTVYIVEAGYDYEGFVITGVYDTKAKAEQNQTTLIESGRYDYVDVNEYIVE